MGITLLLGVVLLYLFDSRRETSEIQLPSDVFSGEGFKLEDAHFAQDDPEKGTKWTLDAKEARISTDRRFISFNYFRLKLEPENRPRIEIEGDRGDYDKVSGQISLHENLKGRTENGYRMMTDHLLYQQKEGYLKTESPVKIIGPSFILEGRGLYVDLKKELLSLQSDVTAVIENEAFVL